jgi:hypothetical protein
MHHATERQYVRNRTLLLDCSFCWITGDLQLQEVHSLVTEFWLIFTKINFLHEELSSVAWGWLSAVTERLRSNIVLVYCITKSRDSSVGIALRYGLHDRGFRVWFLVGAGNFSLHHHVQNGSGAHPASYRMGTRGSFPGVKAAGAWSWPLTSI